MVIPVSAKKTGGFSLIELLIVLVIIAILMNFAMLPFQEMIANQRLKSVVSDLIGDLSLARGEAIKRSTQVGIARDPAGWLSGWRIFVDTDRDGTVDVGEEVLMRRPALNDTVRFCTVGTNADNTIDALTFGADGRVRTFLGGALKQGVTGIVINSTTVSTSIPARRMEFTPSGRMSVETNGIVNCP
jgi:prepilin-type N-terminal cleavage/methylation domain-containing protein